MFRAAGYWQYNEYALKDLGLLEHYKRFLGEHGNNMRKGMTATMIYYIQENCAKELDELRFVIKKAQNYLVK